MQHASSARSEHNAPARQVSGGGCRKRSRVFLQKADIMPLVNMPQSEAAALLGVSLTALKNACRRLNIARWPSQHRRFYQEKTDRLCASPPGRKDSPDASPWPSDRAAGPAHPRAALTGGWEWLPSPSQSCPYPASAYHAAAALAQTAGGPVRPKEIQLHSQRGEASHGQVAYTWCRDSDYDGRAGFVHGFTPTQNTAPSACPANDFWSSEIKCHEDAAAGSMYDGGCSGTSTSTGSGGIGSSEDGGTGGGTGSSEDTSEDGNGSDDCKTGTNTYSINSNNKQGCAGGSQSSGAVSQSESGSGTPDFTGLPKELDFDRVLRNLGRGASKLIVEAKARDATACLDQWL
jgi:hypothetical protein